MSSIRSANNNNRFQVYRKVTDQLLLLIKRIRKRAKETQLELTILCVEFVADVNGERLLSGDDV